MKDTMNRCMELSCPAVTPQFQINCEADLFPVPLRKAVPYPQKVL